MIKGLTVGNQLGNFHPTNSELELASLDSDKSFCIQLKYDDKLEEKSEPCIQCALLYPFPSLSILYCIT